MVLERVKIKVVVEKKFADMEDCIMIIHTGYQNANIMTAAQYSMNTVKTIRHGMDCRNGDYEASRKGPNKHSDAVHIPEFTQQLQV